MANFHNTINSVGTLYQAENMTFGGQISSGGELSGQIVNLQRLLDKLTDIPQETKAAASQQLEEAKQVSETEPGSAPKVLKKLEATKVFLQAATDIAKQVTPLIGAIGAVVGAAAGLVG